MIYSEPLFNQISRFLDSVGMGFILCGLYIAVKVLFRIFGKGKITVAVSDGVFCVLTAFVSFFYMLLENSGTVRFNLVVGQLIGGLSLYFTVGRFILRLLYLIADGINALIRGVTYPIRLLAVGVFKLPLKLIKALCKAFGNIKKPHIKQTDENVDKKIKLL
ncbi:MAG: spore cortex biosynthesis protein YabQ [Clostridia bacterium]|nr:spore cortex biosynthesis protein YabQ [Clostridia bacterium]